MDNSKHKKLIKHKKHCSSCKRPFGKTEGRMLFHPNLCLGCVVDKENHETITDSNRPARGGHAE